MSCDLDALNSIDADDPDSLNALMQQCTSMLFSPELWLWGIAFTVVGAIGGALIGRYKKAVVRDALLGAALGPIGWVISAFLPVAKPPVVCPACKRVVGPADVHCKFCGARVTPVV
jgi:hypothetical protein